MGILPSTLTCLFHLIFFIGSGHLDSGSNSYKAGFLKLLRHVFNSNTVPFLNDIHRNIRCAYSIQCLTVPAPTKSHVSSLFTFTSIFYNPMTVPEIIRAFPKVGPTHYCIWGIQGHTSAERKK